jgi:hypothetical protein
MAQAKIGLVLKSEKLEPSHQAAALVLYLYLTI